jgi:hypothetical protein
LPLIWTPSTTPGGFFTGDGVRVHSGGGAWAFADIDGEAVFHTEAYDDANENGFLTQTLNTVAGQSYSLSFWLFDGEGSNPASFSGSFLFNQFLADWNGSQVFLLQDYNPFLSNNSDGSLPFQEFTVTGLVATSATTELTLGGFQDISAYVLDDVVVTQDQDQPVTTPEPATVMLLLPGLAGVALFASRRRR